MNQQIIDKVRAIVEKRYRSNPFDYDHHIKLVVEYAKELAKRLKADEEIVELGAWLHDISRVGALDVNDDHHIRGAAESEKLLRELGYSEERIKQVVHCVISHRGRMKLKRESLEAEIVASADAMSHFFSIEGLFYVALIIKKLDIAEAKIWVKEKLERSWNKLLPEAKEIIRPKYEAAKILLNN